MKFGSFRSAVIALIVLLAATPAAPLLAGTPEQQQAAFTCTDDPARVVLFVQSTKPSTGVRDTMTIYGDGRLSLARHQEGATNRSELRLTAKELHELLRQVVDDGLAEFDPTTIRARQIDSNGGFHPKSSSGPLVKVLLSLETLKRGERTIQPVEKAIDFMSPQLSAERFPEIREYSGLVRLLEYMEAAFQQAGGAAP